MSGPSSLLLFVQELAMQPRPGRSLSPPRPRQSTALSALKWLLNLSLLWPGAYYTAGASGPGDSAVSQGGRQRWVPSYAKPSACRAGAWPLPGPWRTGHSQDTHQYPMGSAERACGHAGWQP